MLTFQVKSSRMYSLNSPELSSFMEQSDDDGIITSDNYPNSHPFSYTDHSQAPRTSKNFNVKSAAYKIYLTDIDYDTVDETTGLYCFRFTAWFVGYF